MHHTAGAVPPTRRSNPIRWPSLARRAGALPALLATAGLALAACALRSAAEAEPARLVWWQDSLAPQTSGWSQRHRFDGSILGLMPAGDATLPDPRARDLGAWDDPCLHLLVAPRDLRALSRGELPAAWRAALEEAGQPLPPAATIRSVGPLAADGAGALIRLPEALRAVADAPGGRSQPLGRAAAGAAPALRTHRAGSPAAGPPAAARTDERSELWGAMRLALRADRMFADLDYLSTELATRYAYTPQMDLACDYALAQFEQLGLTAWSDEFSYNGYALRNVVAVKEGLLEPSVIYLIGGHLDSISNTPWTLAPGAEDNGSGAAGVIEAARLLAPLSCDQTIYFVCFSAEEQGLRGSAHFAAWAAQQDLDIRGVLIQDMIGYYDPAGTDLWLEGFRDAPSSVWLMNLVQANAARYAGLSVYQYPGDGWGSDHVPFHNHGFPAILAIENEWDSYPCYHRPCDEVAWLDAGLWSSISAATTISLAQLAGVQDGLGALFGRVRAQGGGPLAGARVSIFGTGYPMQISAAGGGFGWSELLPGSYTLLAERFGYEPATLEIAVAGGGLLEVEMSLAPQGAAAVAEASEPDPSRARLRLVPGMGASPAVVQLRLPQGDRGSLAVYAPDGRLQRRLASAVRLEAGEHAFAWDGRDRKGRRLPSGAYIARWEGEGHRAQSTLVLAR